MNDSFLGEISTPCNLEAGGARPPSAARLSQAAAHVWTRVRRGRRARQTTLSLAAKRVRRAPAAWEKKCENERRPA